MKMEQHCPLKSAYLVYKRLVSSAIILTSDIHTRTQARESE